MAAPLDVEFYGQILSRMDYKSIEYYLTARLGERHFDGDPELRSAFVEAQEAVNRFVDLLYDRIDAAGGDPESYEAV
jgi:hypothetical protein